jgi:hypothetical protein
MDPNGILAADRINRLLMGAFGRLNAMADFGDRLRVSEVYFAPAVGKYERSMLEQAAVRYLVVDYRLTTGLPVLGHYFAEYEPGTRDRTEPIDREALEKFDDLALSDRLFDDGEIVIYDVGMLTNAR